VDRAPERRRSRCGRKGVGTVRRFTVILTRPSGRNEKLARLLRGHQHDVVIEPLIEVESLDDAPIDVEGYDWVVVTSATGARELRRRMRGTPRRVAAIGRATAAAFGRVDLVPKIATQEGLLAELPRPAGRVLFAGAARARRLLIDELHADFIPLYRTRELRPSRTLHGDLVVLASPSAARAFAALDLEIPAVTIGPETTTVAEEAGIRVLREAATSDLDGLVTAVVSVSR
jgi:uroporphyrinogen-III synthase